MKLIERGNIEITLNRYLRVIHKMCNEGEIMYDDSANFCGCDYCCMSTDMYVDLEKVGVKIQREI